jgi:hypothetical protein
MSRKREAIFMGVGILAGLALSGPAAQAATTVAATFSSQPIYVDGQRVSMTAYSIGGNNYVRLRDIGKAVDFGVTYDAASNTVQINSTQPYREEAPQIVPGLIGGECANFAGTVERTISQRNSLSHAIPLHQQRPVHQGHPLCWLGQLVL